ncbi:MAG TPA: EamA family transporter, partial [Longimicrobiales bacterium]|nr:EamA family transporter [Longimicrobiales bacterium]
MVLAAFAAVYLIWGSTYLAILFAIETIPPFLMAGVRFLTAGAVLFGWLRWKGEPWPRREAWAAAAVIGTLLILAGNGSVTWAEQRVPSGVAALLVATVPLWMVVLEALRPGGARPAGLVVLGLLAGFGGLAMLVAPGKGGGVDPVGAGVLLAGSFAWASGSIYSRTAVRPRAPLMGVATQMLAGGALLVGAGTLAGEWARVDVHAVSTGSVVALLYLILFGSLVGYSAYIWLLGVSTPDRVSTYAYVNPVVAVFLGWAVVGEPVTPRVLAASAVIVGAVAVITLSGTVRRP